jgi:hypothetical protein
MKNGPIFKSREELEDYISTHTHHPNPITLLCNVLIVASLILGFILAVASIR